RPCLSGSRAHVAPPLRGRGGYAANRLAHHDGEHRCLDRTFLLLAVSSASSCWARRAICGRSHCTARLRSTAAYSSGTRMAPGPWVGRRLSTRGSMVWSLSQVDFARTTPTCSATTSRGCSSRTAELPHASSEFMSPAFVVQRCCPFRRERTDGVDCKRRTRCAGSRRRPQTPVAFCASSD